MARCSAAGLDFRIIPAGFNAPLEFLTGFTMVVIPAPIFIGINSSRNPEKQRVDAPSSAA